MDRIGEIVSFGTAICWTAGAIFFERGIKRIGVLPANFFKVVFAAVFLTLTAAIMRGVPIPVDAPARAYLFLPISGLVGFVITDMFLFSVFGGFGKREAMLFMALSPPATAGMAYLVLGETIGSQGWLGMGLVIIGIFMTVFGRQNSLSFSKITKEDRRGYLYAAIAPICNSAGVVLSKAGLGDYHPVSGTQIRVFTAIIGFGLMSLIYDRGKGLKAAAHNREGLKFTAIGAIFGPFLGVSLLLFALQQINAGVVSTFTGLTPVLIMIPEKFIFKKKLKPLEIAGAFIAVLGTTVFFLW